MKLYRFLHRAENETQANMEKERRKGGKSAVAVLVRQLAAGEMYEFGEPWKLTSESLSAVVPILRRFHSDRKYLLIQEVSEKRLSVTDSGRINKLSVKLRGLKRLSL